MGNQFIFCIASPPPIWQWVGILAGLIALVVSIVAGFTIFQMIGGKHKFDIQYITSDGYDIACWIKGIPPSRFLSWLGVERKILTINYMTSIKDIQGKLIDSFLYPSSSSHDIRIHVATIKSTLDNRHVYLKSENNDYKTLLLEGVYLFELNIWDYIYGLKVKHSKCQKRFKVNKSSPFVEWI